VALHLKRGHEPSQHLTSPGQIAEVLYEMIDYQKYPQGSAGFCDTAMLRRAGLFEASGAFIGVDPASGRKCYASGQSAILVCGGPRSCKGSISTPWLVDGHIRDANGPHHIIALDLKQQDTVIASQQVPHRRWAYYFNPRLAQAMAAHRMNPLSHLRPELLTLAADALQTAQSWIPNTDPRAAYFEGMAQRLFAAAAVTYARVYGEVTLPGLADKLAGLGAATDEWLSFEYEISRQPESQIYEVATLLQELRKGNADSGGFAGIKNEISRSFNCMMDAQLRAAVSPPFDFDAEWLTRSDMPPCLISIMEHLDYAEVSAPIIRALLTNILITKRRAALTARPQFWLLNEIAHFKWPLAQELGTISAGYGIRTAYVVQSSRQLDTLKPGASDVIPNSSGVQIYVGTRSVQQASLIARQLGTMSLDYYDPVQAEHARHAKSRAMADLVLGRGDVVSSWLDASHYDRLAREPKKLSRDLRTADEILNTPMGLAYVFMPGILERPALLHIPNYWQRRDLAGLYLGDPMHAKPGTVEIATRWGQRHRRVITEPVPNAYAEWPQYRDHGLWSYVKGYRP